MWNYPKKILEYKLLIENSTSEMLESQYSTTNRPKFKNTALNETTKAIPLPINPF
jgi:uncharacterized protein (UPF0276 family)